MLRQVLPRSLTQVARRWIFLASDCYQGVQAVIGQKVGRLAECPRKRWRKMRTAGRSGVHMYEMLRVGTAVETARSLPVPCRLYAFFVGRRAAMRALGVLTGPVDDVAKCFSLDSSGKRENLRAKCPTATRQPLHFVTMLEAVPTDVGCRV